MCDKVELEYASKAETKLKARHLDMVPVSPHHSVRHIFNILQDNEKLAKKSTTKSGKVLQSLEAGRSLHNMEWAGVT